MAGAPQRTCVGCRSQDSPQQLIRFVLVGNRLSWDRTKHADGRGAWLHPRLDCLQAARKRGAFARSFRCKVDDAGLEDLAEWLLGPVGQAER